MDVTPWQVLVSEVMLQQTPAARVIGPWTDWVLRWPGSAELAVAPRAAVLRQWDRLGYPGRALRLQDAAIAIERDHGGQVPEDYEALRALPGVGDYTAAAVLAFAFGQRSTVLDVNIRRVIARVWHGTERPPTAVTRLEREFATSLVPADPRRAAQWSAAAMELGAVVCRARQPACDQCPVRRDCAWHAAGHPPGTVPLRTQAFTGTDRQVRGLVLQRLRESASAVPPQAIAVLWPDQEQLHRAVDSLVADGLAQRTPTGRLRLPQ